MSGNNDHAEDAALNTDRIKKEFSDRLQRILLERGWNQSELARRASVFMDKPMGRDNVSIYIRGRSLPGMKHLSALARALGVDNETLLPERSVLNDNTDYRIPVEMKAIPERPGTARLKIDQDVKFQTALKIMQILQDDERDTD